MPSAPFFDHLFDISRQVTPYLDGVIMPIPADAEEQGIVHMDHPSSENIQHLYHRLAEAHPEAGTAYWLTRTWDLLCWQPIYVAFISIYACRGLPPIKQMGLSVQPNFIAGYRFDSEEYFEGTTEDLIAAAGKDLQQLFDYFRQEISLWTRIRPGFTRHLFADAILGCIVKLQAFQALQKNSGGLSNETLLEHAKLWLDACGLPSKHLATLSAERQDRPLKLVRTSCCLVYKCQGRQLCGDCPRREDNRVEKHQR